jgi:hypothetical protein
MLLHFRIIYKHPGAEAACIKQDTAASAPRTNLLLLLHSRNRTARVLPLTRGTAALFNRHNTHLNEHTHIMDADCWKD